jgi:hypothetical protein
LLLFGLAITSDMGDITCMEIINSLHTGNKTMTIKSLNDQYGNAIFVGNEVSFKYDVEQESEVLDIKIETGEILVFNENQMCNLWIDADRCELEN